MNEQIPTGEVSSIAFGGQGIIRQDGLVVFVPFTAVGETVRYAITQRKKHFAIGEVVDIVKPSTQRTEPLCPYFGTCGGCQLQHIKYASQLEYKRIWIEEALRRQANLKDIGVPSIVPSPQEWTYRRRISLSLVPHQNHFKAGYIANDNRSLLEVDQCPIFTEASPNIFSIVPEIGNSLTPHDGYNGKLTILKKDNQQFILHFHFRTMPKNASMVLEKASIHFPLIAGILATSSHETLQYGQIESSFNINGLHIAFSPKAFIQANPEQSLNIYHEVSLQAEKCSGRSILDLYCGIGISSLLIAQKGFNVTGIENNATAIELAKLNAQKNKITNVLFYKADVEKALTTHLKTVKPEMVIVNPPREGLMPSVIEALIHQPIQTLIYVSCMPPTLARDLKQLCQSSYKLELVKGYDMFPQTTHVETLSVLKKKL